MEGHVDPGIHIAVTDSPIEWNVRVPLRTIFANKVVEFRLLRLVGRKLCLRSRTEQIHPHFSVGGGVVASIAVMLLYPCLRCGRPATLVHHHVADVGVSVPPGHSQDCLRRRQIQLVSIAPRHVLHLRIGLPLICLKGQGKRSHGGVYPALLRSGCGGWWVSYLSRVVYARNGEVCCGRAMRMQWAAGAYPDRRDSHNGNREDPDGWYEHFSAGWFRHDDPPGNC